MRHRDRLLRWLAGEVKTPPFSVAARIETGVLLRRLQRGDLIAMPHSRPLPVVGRRCHELRISDLDRTWRIIYRTHPDAIVILDVFSKKTQTTPYAVIERCKTRLREYDRG